MQYRFDMTYEEADFIGLMAAYASRAVKTQRSYRLLQILARLAGAFMVITGCANLVLSVLTVCKGGSVSLGFWAACVIIIAAGLVIFYSKDAGRSGKILWKKYNKKGSRVSFVFSPDGFKRHDRDSDDKYGYDSIKDIVEDGERYYLFYSRSDGHILRKDSVKDPEGFGPFIEARTGLDVVRLRDK